MGESSGQSEKEVLEALVYSWYLKPPGTSGGRERETVGDKEEGRLLSIALSTIYLFCIWGIVRGYCTVGLTPCINIEFSSFSL